MRGKYSSYQETKYTSHSNHLYFTNYEKSYYNLFIFSYETMKALNHIIERLNEATFYPHPHETFKIKRETLFNLNLNISDIPIRCKLCQIIKKYLK